MALIWGQLSHARRKKVGCLIVKDGRIISDGYNGTPRGFDNNCEVESTTGLETKPEVIHAESNSLTKLAMSTQTSAGATLYVTISPCFDCSKLMIQSGITRVVYSREYRDSSGVDLLRAAGIDIAKVEVEL